jgi:hypothetical protein
LNINYWVNLNEAVAGDAADAGAVALGEAQLGFLNETLARVAASPGQRAYILGHEPPKDTWLPGFYARFRVLLGLPASLSDEEAGAALLARYILVHLGSDGPGCADKFALLLLMLRKLYAFVRGDCLEDNADSLSNQEMLLSGHLLQALLKEKLEDYLAGVETSLRLGDAQAERGAARGAPAPSPAQAAKLAPAFFDPQDGAAWRRVLARQADPGRRLANFIATAKGMMKLANTARKSGSTK